MLLNTSGADFAGFDPSKPTTSLPPVGVYANHQLKIIGSKIGNTKAGDTKLDVTFEFLNGSLTGSVVTCGYNTGHHDPKSSVIAIKNLLSIAFAITGVDFTGKQFNFDEKLYNKTFIATLEIKEGTAKRDDGTPFLNANIKNVKPFAVDIQPNSQIAEKAIATPAAIPAYAIGDTPSWNS